LNLEVYPRKEQKMADLDQGQSAVTPVQGRVHVYFDDAEIASSLKGFSLREAGREQVFIPLEDIHPQILEASDTRRTVPALGEAHYYTIKTLTADGVDEAWYFPYADGAFAPIRDLVTFGGDRIVIKVTEV
jgi:uncharacterized protein (DUF427 family)